MTISSLKNQTHFDLVNKHGVKFHTNHFIMVLAENWYKKIKLKKSKNLKTQLDINAKTIGKPQIYPDELANSNVASMHTETIDTSRIFIKKTFPFSSTKASLPLSMISLGMKVNKKLGNAVTRNKIKRRIRHMIRLITLEYTLLNEPGIIIIPRKGFEDVSFSILLCECRKLFQNKLKNLLNYDVQKFV